MKLLAKANLIMTKEIWTRPLNFLQQIKYPFKYSDWACETQSFEIIKIF